jgi:hypothetical protein
VAERPAAVVALRREQHVGRDRDGVDGIHCRTLDDMVGATRRILSDSEWQGKLAASARERARQFSHEAFTEALLSAVA